MFIVWDCGVLCTIIVPGYGGDISKQIPYLRVLLIQIRLAVHTCPTHIYTHISHYYGDEVLYRVLKYDD